MKVILAFMFFVLGSHCVSAENILLLQNGENIRFTSYQIEKHVLTIKGTDGSKQSFHCEDVAKYFDSWREVFYQLRKHPGQNENESPEYYFAEILVDGQLSLLKENFISEKGNNLNDSKSTRYYISKGSDYQLIFSEDSRAFTPDQLELLRAKVKGNKVTYEKTISSDFVLTKETLVEILKEYNYYNPELAMGSNRKITPVLFYININRLSTALLTGKMIIGDSTEYKIITNQGIAVNLPAGRYIKVCVTTLKETKCSYIIANPFIMSYVEVSIKKDDLDVKNIENVSSKQAINYLQHRRRPY